MIRPVSEFELLQTRVFAHRKSRTASILLISLTLLLVMTAAWSIVFPKRMDFAVYWYDIRGYFQQGLPLYGPGSAFSAPMLFRYPPVFALLYYPFTLLPFRWAGGLWALLEVFSIVAATYWSCRRFRLHIELVPGVMGLLICLPYFYLSFKDGNMQWLDTVLVLSAMLLACKRPGIAGLALSLGIASKVWPILFLPLFLTKRRWRVLRATALWSAAIWLFPLAVWGTKTYSDLLAAWVHQEFATNTALSDIWYPSQSLRGLLLRYLTDPAMTLPYRSEFPDVHFASLAPVIIVRVWSFVAVIAYLFVFTRRQIMGELYFVVFSAFQPFCNWSSLISLTPAVLVAVHVGSQSRRGFWLLALAFALSCAEYMASLSRFDARLFEALGMHFPLMICIGACALQKLKRRPNSIVLGPPD